MPSVTVIVPIFNGSRFLPIFFESLAVALPDQAQLILIDDGSTEPVFDAIPPVPRARQVVRLRNDHNLGYSAAVNRGFAEADGEIIIQLNTDLILTPDCICALIDTIQTHRNVGIVGSKLVYPTTGHIQHVGMAFGLYTRRHVYFGMPADHPLCCRTRPMQIVDGATVATTRPVLDMLGPLDERYFNYNEDVDHCLKARRHGLSNYTCAQSVAYHWVSQSGPARFAKLRESDAVFWSHWGGKYDVDLGRFLDEALEHIIGGNAHMEDVPFHVINLCRSSDEAIALDRLERRWKGISRRIHQARQFNNLTDQLWLPVVLPHWMLSQPTPFVYLVDRHTELSRCAYWFRRRHQIVQQELVVDLNACVLTTSEIDSGKDQELQ